MHIQPGQSCQPVADEDERLARTEETLGWMAINRKAGGQPCNALANSGRQAEFFRDRKAPQSEHKFADVELAVSWTAVLDPRYAT